MTQDGKATGRPGYPAQTLLRALLLGVWHGLSDQRLADQLARDLLFRKFCRLEIDAGTPDATTIGRFRARLETEGRLAALFAAVKAQLEAKNVIMAEGRVAIIDATVVEAARTGAESCARARADARSGGGGACEGEFAGAQRRHLGLPVSGECRRGRLHPRPGRDAWQRARDRGWEGLMTGDEAALYADCAYSAQATRDWLASRGIADQVQRKGYRDHPLPEAEVARNIEIGVTRAGVERIFGHSKRVWGLGRTRFMGLSRNQTHFTLVAIAWNIWKGGRFFKLYGLPTS